MSRNRWLILVIALLVGWQLWTQVRPSATPVSETTRASSPSDGRAFPVVGDERTTPSSIDPASASTPPASRSDGLPPEALTTLRLIGNGGPFPYDRDGIVFGNFEGRLPKQKRGYYREYTVPTPGVSHRGARRIITGGDPPSEFYYTDDHYESFRAIGGAP
jgi:ribonuclease T1